MASPRSVTAYKRLYERAVLVSNDRLRQCFDCSHCSGRCCRQPLNSMMISPFEAMTIIDFLRHRSELEEAIHRCKETIKQFKLSAGRKAYDCPFLEPNNACQIHVVKPVCCLLFGPINRRECDLYQADYIKLWPSIEIINRNCFGRHWRMKPLPVALTLSATGHWNRDDAGR